MKPFIQITRHLYEEPYHLNLVIIASNGQARGSLEFYLETPALKEIGERLFSFPSHEIYSYLFERGSELREDNFGFLFRLFAFKNTVLSNKCHLSFRFNNNGHLRNPAFPVEAQMSDFSFELNVEDLKRFGKLLIDFAKLEHHRLYWSPEHSNLDNELSNLSGWNTDTIANAFNALPK